MSCVDLFSRPYPKCRKRREHIANGVYRCRPCTAAYKRKRRRDHTVTRFKENARSIANVAVRRGKLVRLPCEFCSDKKSEMHHWDYTRPLDVTWLCKACHRLIEAAKRKVAA